MLQSVLGTQQIHFLSSAFICPAVWRLVKGLYLLLYQRHQREELNCLGQSTIAQCVKQDRLGPTLDFTPLYPVFLEIASYHCLISVVGQEVWTMTQHFFNLSQPILNLFGSVELAWGPGSAWVSSGWYPWCWREDQLRVGGLVYGSLRQPAGASHLSHQWRMWRRLLPRCKASRAEQCPTITRRVPHFT